MKVFVAQSYPTHWDPTDCRRPGSSVHGILQARIEEQNAISYSKQSSPPRDWTCISLPLKLWEALNLLPQASVLFRLFTDWAPQTWISSSWQFFTNLLFLCLKSIKAACFGHFLGLISMRPPCTQLKFLFLLLICFVSILLLVQPQELRGVEGEIFPSLTRVTSSGNSKRLLRHIFWLFSTTCSVSRSQARTPMFLVMLFTCLHLT